MKITGHHIVGFLVLVGLAIYFLTKTKVTGTVTADESGAVIRPGSISYDAMSTPMRQNFGPQNTPIDDTSFGTELQKS